MREIPGSIPPSAIIFFGKTGLCRVPRKDTRQNLILPSAKREALGKANGRDGCHAWRARAPDLPCARSEALGISIFCRVPFVCRAPALGKYGLWRVPLVCRVLGSRHSAKRFFAECPCCGSRQTFWHTAYNRFSVVQPFLWGFDSYSLCGQR